MTCNDPNCPEHGGLKTRKKTLRATVVKAAADKTALVEWPRIQQVPKYDRVYRTKSKVSVHVPECIKVKEGDRVLVAETRKLSKTKSFVVVEVLSHGSKD